MSLVNVGGPVMIGPSSSHTLGALRIGRFGNYFLGKTPDKAEFFLHQSFGQTYMGHGTDRALLAGVMGFGDADRAVKDALGIALSRGLVYSFHQEDLGEVHPNTVKMLLYDGADSQEIWASSIGAGMIRIIKINGVECDLSGAYPTLILVNKDIPGALNMILEKIDANVANLYLRRINKLLAKALTIVELDSDLSLRSLLEIKSLPVILEAYYVKSLSDVAQDRVGGLL
ncbi:MAG TPA: L-serine ammonia-lyase, iron-sulfur-dependent subunit beta [Thermotogota bacterium]|mgnify:CR=1 FL=1|nr:L-serine ammonia-lyase, iron-sulfur-dependent subunit beta [Thermotogota bacterium]NLH19511.1 L-serine ammonia-lyase, iron-sulfur-dependent, subunit beta [Thermotogaceae bacterium]OQC31150.1 MAG: L-serine dehydratase, beta chain [Thermotogota bacterium ADurb.Bin062]HNW46423.1 L-serine ammonia-lyase, iron-sulfur-dependent subunit beta [Thermotogota bacterium]HNY81809.1 L-serine ammonia-lyase, iron-sulfur-dependent subunit beta [Thermotogota bacterium]